jgi:hypothetical protein
MISFSIKFIGKFQDALRAKFGTEFTSFAAVFDEVYCTMRSFKFSGIEGFSPELLA